MPRYATRSYGSQKMEPARNNDDEQSGKALIGCVQMYDDEMATTLNVQMYCFWPTQCIFNAKNAV